jgi:hypothetical protein
MTESMTGLAIAMASLKAAKDIAESDPAAFQKRQTEFVSKLLDAYGAVFRAQEEQTALLNRIRELESIEATKDRYKLVSLGAVNVVAYAPKQPEPGEPPHYLCATCLHGGKVHFLQQTGSGQYWDKYTCKACGELSVDKGNPPMPTTYRRGGPRGPQGWMAS